jgi:hypothetical protein
MPIFNPRLDVRPDPFRLSGAPPDKSFARSRSRRPFSNAEEVELALELLQVTSETEFDRFLGDLFTKAWGGIAPVGSKVIGPLRGLLKTVASKALPSIATAAAMSFGPATDAIAENLGSLVSRALEAEVAAPTGADRDLEKCRQLFEKHRQFVRLAGTAATAAATAPPGVNPVVAAQKKLAESANERLTRRDAPAEKTASLTARAPAVAMPTATAKTASFTARAPAVAMPTAAARTAGFTARAPAAATPTAAAAAGRVAKQGPQTKTAAPGMHACSICERSPGSCQCKKVGRSGGWFRSGSSIIVNC